ncbi:unnamed protein product, partial [Polarella glacialis]
MERAAFVKDVQALITTPPQLPARLNPQEAEVALDLLAHTRTLLHFLKHDCVQVLQQHSSAQIVLSSPYAGGCQVNEVGSMYDAGVKHSHITVATLNPGRTGFSQLGSDSLLHWRLWAVASALEDQNINVCGLPGARLPPGAILPSGLPYAWYGVRSSHWDSVGVFVKLEMQESFVPLDEHCCDRVFWFMITKGTRGQGHQTELLGCAFYARPGGDRETWQMLADTYRTLRSKHTTAKFVLFGDANCHLSYVVDHEPQCVCPHCKQSAADVIIESLLFQAGLRACADGRPTHDSGHIIDLVIAPADSPVVSAVFSDPVGASDHRLVIATVMHSWTADLRRGMGRVAWASGDDWYLCLLWVEPLFLQLLEAVQPILASDAFKPESLGGRIPKKLRRAVLDSAAWARDVIYVVAGHTMQAVRVIAQNHKKASVPATASLHPDNFASFEDFKQAAREAANQQQRQAAETYAELRASQPAQAEKWLTSFFSTKAHFQVELLDADSCQPMNISQMIDVLIDDLFARADNDFEEDEQEVKLQTLEVSQIRRSGVPAEIPGSSDQLYTDQELELVLKRLQSTKKCFRGCFAALKAKVIAARAFMLALVNLGRHMALTSTLWSLRCYSPIRKSGPSLVRKVEALRPISLCTDMAHVQDGLWMARNASNLSDYAGGEQCGGASDPQSLVLSLIIQAQLRLHQGLETFWALLDLRWAFDVASVAGMKINCWHAGVKRQDWLLIDDVLDMDTQCLQLHGCLSQLFKLRCGTAQGRKFSIHVFNGLLKWLRESVQSTLPTGLAACVPAWAVSAYHYANTLAPPTQLYKRPGVASEMLPLCATFQAALSILAQSTDAYNFTVGFLVTMQSDAERRLLLNSIGTHPICVAQFVDDATVPWDSVGSVKAVLSKAAFTQLFHIAESGGFSAPVLAAQVMSRVQPLVVFAAVFFAFAPGALTKLDALQWQWGKAILGCRFSKEFKRALVVAQCGWTLRLSSALMEEVAVMLARLAALPLSHPAAVMLAATEQTLASTWVSQARAMLDHSSLPCAIPALCVCVLYGCRALRGIGWPCCQEEIAQEVPPGVCEASSAGK